MRWHMDGVRQEVATGRLPRWAEVQQRTDESHARYRDHDDGVVADYIPVLAEADPAWFGVAVAGNDGLVHVAGDSEVRFSIQSISKAFVYALVRDALGHDLVKEQVGVNNTGLAYDSVMAIELNDGHPLNPMVNAGALATTALVPGATSAAQWESIRTTLSGFAGRQLELGGAVYHSEMLTNQRNKAIARLLESYGQIARDPLETVDVYTRQCSMMVSARDLAIMGATLADGGVNPVTGERVVGPGVCRDTLAVLASTGLYERSGEWLFEIGLPAKSGVAGGLVAIAPGKGAIGTFSPPLDSAGNSVRGRRATAHLSRTLGLNLFASSAAQPAT